VVSPAEMKEVVSAYKDKGDIKQVQSSGIHIAGERFVVLKADDRSIYGKKVRSRGVYADAPSQHIDKCVSSVIRICGSTG
jgi:hypothetical protein